MKINFDQSKLKIVNIDEVRPNTWNPKDKDTPELDKIEKSLDKKGLRQPIVVRENKGYEIIDGEQRWTASKRLGAKQILIYNEGLISDKEAQELTIFYQQQVPFENISLAGLITKLVSEYPEIELPYSSSEIDEFQNVSKFDWSEYEKNNTDESEEKNTNSITFTDEQYEIVRQAIDKVRKNQEKLSDGRCLELICADYLS